MATVLLLAGHATTTNLIANAVLALLRHPDQLAAVRADPSLIDGLVEETLRYDGPAANPTLRFTKRELTIGHTVVPAHEVVVLSLAGADRDPARFADPDTFDVGRAGV